MDVSSVQLDSRWSWFPLLIVGPDWNVMMYPSSLPILYSPIFWSHIRHMYPMWSSSAPWYFSFHTFSDPPSVHPQPKINPMVCFRRHPTRFHTDDYFPPRSVILSSPIFAYRLVRFATRTSKMHGYTLEKIRRWRYICLVCASWDPLRRGCKWGRSGSRVLDDPMAILGYEDSGWRIVGGIKKQRTCYIQGELYAR